MHFSSLPWEEMLEPNHLLEVIIRGTLTYWGLLILLRVVLKRQSSNVASSDLLITVLISDAIQNSMAGGYTSVPDGLVLVATLLGWDYFTDWLSFKSKTVQKLLTSEPLLIIQAGVLNHRNMRKEFLTKEEIWIKLREAGISKLSEVKSAYLENDGEISVIKYK